MERRPHNPTEQYISALVGEGIDANLTLAEACTAALGRIKRDGRSDEVLAQIGVRALADFWSTHQRCDRRATLWTQPGKRKVNVALLGRADRILRSYEAVGDRQIRIRDLTADDCARLSEARAKNAAGNHRAAEVWASFSRRLRRGKLKNVASLPKAEFMKLYRRLNDE